VSKCAIRDCLREDVQYKYHRVSGYLILILVLVNVALASLTYYAGNILGIKLWSTVVGGIFVVIGKLALYFIWRSEC
jgi:hypothetical protein